MPTEKRRLTEFPVLDNEQLKTQGFSLRTAYFMLIQTLEASEILQNGHVREDILVDWAAELNSEFPEWSDNLRKLPSLGPWPVVAVTSYKAIQEVFKLKLTRLVLQKLLWEKIGPVLTLDDDKYEEAAEISHDHTKKKDDHSQIAEKVIAATFNRFMTELTSEQGLSAKTLTIDMIHEIMTQTVFGGYKNTEVASWKDEIVYFLQHLIDVQQAYAVGAITEKLPKIVQRALMRLVAKKQRVSDVLENMFRIEDKLFPRIV